MNQNVQMVPVDVGSGEIIHNARAVPKSFQQPAALLPGKAGQQLAIAQNAIYNRKTVTTAGMYFGINEFGMRYCMCKGAFYVFESPAFDDVLTTLSIEELLFFDLKPNVIAHLKTLLIQNMSWWVQDHDGVTNPSIRVINQGMNYIGYALKPGYIVPLLFIQSNPPYPTQGIYLPTEAKWSSFQPNYDPFNQSSLMAMQQNPHNGLNNLYRLMDTLGIPSQEQLLLLSALAHSLIAKKHLLIEITGDNEKHCSLVFETLKVLIDNTVEPCKPIPKKATDIKHVALQDYLISFEQHSDKVLKEDMQATIIEILNGSAVVDMEPKAKYTSRCRVKRPIMIKSPASVVSIPSLQKRTISINLPKTDAGVINDVIGMENIDQARIELLRLIKLVSHSIYPNQWNANLPYRVEVNDFDEMKDLILLGCEMSYLIHGTPKQFVDEFKQWAIEDSFMRLDDNDTAYLFYLYAEDHLDTNPTQPMKDWKNALEFYGDSENIDLTHISERKLGADLKQAIPLLNKLGIECYSNGRSKRLSSWTVDVKKSVGLNESIQILPSNSPHLNQLNAQQYTI